MLTCEDSNPNFSPSHVAYSTSQAPALQTLSVPRYRTASLAFPSGLDLPNHFRALPSQNTNQVMPPTPRATSYSGAYNSGGFPSAPLLAPREFQIPRTPVDREPKDYAVPQLSAPMAPSQDFSTAYDQNLSPRRASMARQAFSQHPNDDNMHEQQQR